MNIKVLGGGCRNCENLLAAVKEAVAEKGIKASTPALMVDNKVVSMGRVLKAKEVMKLL